MRRRTLKPRKNSTSCCFWGTGVLLISIIFVILLGLVINFHVTLLELMPRRPHTERKTSTPPLDHGHHYFRKSERSVLSSFQARSISLNSTGCSVNPAIKFWSDETLELNSPLFNMGRRKKYVVYEPDQGGWNNIRYVVCISF